MHNICIHSKIYMGTFKEGKGFFEGTKITVLGMGTYVVAK